MSEMCKAINLRGEYEGQQCERKASKFGYCASHLRSKHIQKELAALGIDVNKPDPSKVVIKSGPTKPTDLLETKPVAINKTSLKPKPKTPKLTKTQIEEKREKSFAAAFEANLYEKINSGEDININEIYNDNYETVDDEPIIETMTKPAKAAKPAKGPKVVKREIPIEPDIEDDIDESEIPEVKEVDPATAYRRKLSAVNFVKKMANFGVFVTCGIVENTTPTMRGYTHALMSKDDYNTFLDEAAESYADFLGVSNISPEYKLAGLAIMVAAEVAAINKGLSQNIAMPVPRDYKPDDEEPQQQKKDYSPAYED